MKVSVNNTTQVGQAIKAARLSQGLDQFSTADLSGAGQSFISHIENGKETAQIGKVFEVLASLGIGVELTLPPGVSDYLTEIINSEHRAVEAEKRRFYNSHLHSIINPATGKPVKKMSYHEGFAANDEIHGSAKIIASPDMDKYEALYRSINDFENYIAAPDASDVFSSIKSIQTKRVTRT